MYGFLIKDDRIIKTFDQFDLSQIKSQPDEE